MSRCAARRALWNQATEWPAYEEAARRVDRSLRPPLGLDHLYAIFGDPLQPIFEGR